MDSHAEYVYEFFLLMDVGSAIQGHLLRLNNGFVVVNFGLGEGLDFLEDS